MQRLALGTLLKSGGWGEGLEGRASTDASKERERPGQTGAWESGKTGPCWDFCRISRGGSSYSGAHKSRVSQLYFPLLLASCVASEGPAAGSGGGG